MVTKEHRHQPHPRLHCPLHRPQDQQSYQDNDAMQTVRTGMENQNILNYLRGSIQRLPIVYESYE